MGARVCLSADEENEALFRKVVLGLRQNMGITHFAVRVEDSQVCSCNHCGLKLLARRNVGLKMAKQVVPKPHYFVDGLLPFALRQLGRIGDSTCTYVCLKQFSGRLLEPVLPPNPTKPQEEIRSKKNKRRTGSCCLVEKGEEEDSSRGGMPAPATAIILRRPRSS